jgi:hypothetical protein
MEGNTMALSQVKVLLEEGRAVGNKELREYLEIQAYAEAAHWVYDQAVGIDDWTGHDLINLTELRKIHTLVVEPVWRHAPPDGQRPEEGPGSFRRHDVRLLLSGFSPPPWPEVPALISDWLKTANSRPPAQIHPTVHLADPDEGVVAARANGQLTHDVPTLLREDALRRHRTVPQQALEFGQFPFDLLANGFGNHEMTTRDEELHGGASEA